MSLGVTGSIMPRYHLGMQTRPPGPLADSAVLLGWRREIDDALASLVDDRGLARRPDVEVRRAIRKLKRLSREIFERSRDELMREIREKVTGESERSDPRSR